MGWFDFSLKKEETCADGKHCVEDIVKIKSGWKLNDYGSLAVTHGWRMNHACYDFVVTKTNLCVNCKCLYVEESICDAEFNEYLKPPLPKKK